ncbi:uncharacterized protein [Oncorhynchus clarkii lewisi]|uniref:uncharacterized protein n=1 Tax=Oncorhynchus clarkii lewisi TaxID=490388 RepID=UPI0039B980E3
MKAIQANDEPHLCLFATRDIVAGEELTYSYGDSDWPWTTQVIKADVSSSPKPMPRELVKCRFCMSEEHEAKVVLEESALVELEVVPETQMSTGSQSISRPQGEVGGATGELGSSLNEVYIDEEAFGALVGEMKEIVEELQVSQTRTAECGSISPLPATPRTKRDASTPQQALQEPGLFVHSVEARRKNGGGPESGGPCAVYADGDGVFQAFSGTPGPPIHNPNPFPASWASQKGDAVDGEASEVGGQEPLSVDVRGVGEMGGSMGGGKAGGASEAAGPASKFDENLYPPDRITTGFSFGSRRLSAFSGCPLSALLFVLYMEPLAAAIRADAGVEGLLVPGSGGLRVKVTQYTDDTTLLLCKDSCLLRSLAIIGDFTRAS